MVHVHHIAHDSTSNQKPTTPAAIRNTAIRSATLFLIGYGLGLISFIIEGWGG